MYCVTATEHLYSTIKRAKQSGALSALA